MKREIFFGLLWGLTLGLLIVVLLFSAAKSADLEKGGKLEISISGDSIKFNLDTDGILKSITINGDSVSRNDSGLVVDNELLIEGSKIYIDGTELTRDQLGRLSINQDEDVYANQRHDRFHKQLRRKRLATIYSDSENDKVGFEDVLIDSTARIIGNVVSISGDITIYGVVNGDIVSVLGNVNLKNGCSVQGDITAPFGHIFREPLVTVRGNTSDHKQDQRVEHQPSFDLSFRFNRVEGFTFLPSLTYEDKKGKIPSLSISSAYAVTLKRWEYDFGIKHRFLNNIGPYFEAHLLQVAQSSDRWLFTDTENTIAGLIFKEDFYDFYWMRGFTGEAGLYKGYNLTAGATFTAAKISNLQRTAEKAIFGGKKKFRENWSTVLPDSSIIQASTGDLEEVGLKIDLDTRKNLRSIPSGIHTALDWRKAFNSGGYDFKYQMVTGEIADYLSVTPDQTVYFRIRGGYSDDALPLFRSFFLGGVGSLRGYDYKEFSGNRFILLNTDYLWRFGHSDLGAGLFFDTGKASVGGNSFESANLKSDIGICFLIADAFRLDLAQRLDDLDKSPVVFGRIQLTM
jgi:hypothetical protein